jgi:glycosyltransferase involved in cell wall biosynthesis
VKPRISVILFVRNMAAYIENALSSVLSQSSENVELLVYDGASSDGTAEFLARFKDRFAHFSPGPDGGPAYAINDGIARASGDIVVLLAGDDWLEQGALQHIAREFSADPDLDMLCCGVRIAALDSNGNVATEKRFEAFSDLAFTMDRVLESPLTHGRILRKRVYERIGPYDTSIPITHDLDFLIRCMLAGIVWKVSPFLVYTYRMHRESRTLSGEHAPLARMVRDNCVIARRYVRSPSLRPRDRRALADLLARATARAITGSLQAMDLRSAWKHAAETFLVDPFWLFRFAKQLPRWIGRVLLRVVRPGLREASVSRPGRS